MYLISRPSPTTPNRICIPPHNTPIRASRVSAVSGAMPFWVNPIMTTARTAAAGAHGAVISRLVPPKTGAMSPSAMVPRMPAMAPCAACSPPSGRKIATPKAIAEGNATSIAASPPQNSSAGFSIPRILGMSTGDGL
jgi:hypothetical protein